MLNNVVYVSGAHGSGKSTLIKDICQDKRIFVYSRAYELDIEDTFNAALWKLTKYYIEQSHHKELSKEISDKTTNAAIIADRCVYDNMPYTSAFVKLGMITKEQKRHHDAIFDAMFPYDARPKNIIYLAPEADWIKERLKERWKNVKGWKEDNFNYLEAVVEEYEKFYNSMSGVRILKITETDRNKRAELVRQWIKANILSGDK